MPSDDRIMLVDEGGGELASTPKNAVATTDAFHGVFLLLLTPRKQLIVSTIGQPDGNQRFSATAMTVRRIRESAETAAQRILKQALQNPVPLFHLGDQFYPEPSGRKVYLSVFYGIANLGSQATGCTLMTAEQLEDAMQNCTPALQFVWRTYKDRLPV